MWKNYLQQWRHRMQTVTELLLPVLTMVMVLIVRWQIEPTKMDTIVYQPIRAGTLHYSIAVMAGMNLSEWAIVYSPESPVLEKVVKTAVSNLLVENKETFLPILIENTPNLPPIMQLSPTDLNNFVKGLIKVVPYQSGNDLRGLYVQEKTTRSVIAAIEFNDDLYNAETLPNDLSYALRFPERPRLNSFYQLGGRTWKTDSVYPLFEVPGPRFAFSWEGGNDPGYVNEMFIALQHVISTELISKMIGEDLSSFHVNIQRFPHPPFVQDFAVKVMQLMFPMFLMLSFGYTAVNIARAVTVEKELQLKETMKTMGLPTWLHWTAWFCKQFSYLLISAILIVIILKVNWFTTTDGFSDYAVFTNTHWTVLLFFVMLYLTCTIFFAFMISSLFSKGSTAALFMGVIWFISYIPGFLLAMDINMSTTVQTITCLSINSAMSFGFQLMVTGESTGGLQWGGFMASPSTDSTRFTFGHVVIMLVIDCVLYMLIALYLEQVLPGPFGTPKPWNFPFQLNFWYPKYTSDSATALKKEDSAYEDKIIQEQDPIDHPIGVEIKNLTKIFGNYTAVNNFSLNIYENQITVLLGHNGAGKSTTISMLTGNLKPTHGSVNVAGYDLLTEVSAARSHIGLCSQHNVLFNELTVKEHLEFYARLKGFKGKELESEINTLISKLELEDKRDYPSNGLSGGQKRRLCVGIALSGAARVVLLDEPTSGMDPASRRALWDLLQNEKKCRSMILTTHFMDEADILGDRVAIMAQGRLQCVGSPFFLKRHYGIGYTLVVVKDDDFNIQKCSSLINKYIPGTPVKEDRGSEITYSLANESSHVFEYMLKDLENRINRIKFKNYGLTATTLEDVFMSVGADLAPVETENDDATTTLTEASDESNEKGFRLLHQRVLATWMKLGLVWTRSWWMILLLFLTPIFLVNFTLGILQYLLSLVPTIQSRLLMLSEGYASTETVVSFNGTSTSSAGALAADVYENIFRGSGVANMGIKNIGKQSFEEYYLERTNDPRVMGTLRHRLFIGSTFDDNSATAWFSNFGYHDVAISLAAVHSALLESKKPSATLKVNNYPLEATYSDQSDMQVMITMLSMQLAVGVGSSVGIVSAVFIMFYIKERISGAKLLQKAAGMQPLVLWGSAAIFDWLWFVVICTSIVISCAAFSVIGLSTASESGRLFLCIMLYGAAMLPLNYVLSNVFNGPAIGFVSSFFINVLFGMMGAQVVDALLSPELNTENAARMLDNILQFFPLYSLVTSIRYLNQIGLRVRTCYQGCDFMQVLHPNLDCTMENMCKHSTNCCIREDSQFDWEKPGIARYLVSMTATCIVSWLVLMIIEYRLLQKVFTLKKTPPAIDESTLDDDVAIEAELARRVTAFNRDEHALLATDLSKYYGNYLAVDQVSFSVSDGECFGLLGVNGAGKTTTFKMLMGDELISSGEAYVSGHSVTKSINKVYENIGYCPQFDALFDELTGRETIRLFCLMRGLHKQTDEITDTLAHSLGFHKHLDKQVHQYSGGTKRKLNTAIAFMGRTRLVFVDEPTTGVDPAAKRHMWRATRSVQLMGRGVVMTSHSMEECEALCSRLTIMVNGRFQCLGTPQHLKNKFSQGFTLIIKIKLEENKPASVRSSETQTVKKYVDSNFNDAKIMEEYQGLLTYYLPDRKLSWSRIFGIMERGKRKLKIEDYSITQTTLEQVFLQFTKYQQEEL